MLKKIAFGMWGISILYFAFYLMSSTLKVAVNNSSALSIFHGAMALIFLFGIFGLIASFLRALFSK